MQRTFILPLLLVLFSGGFLVQQSLGSFVAGWDSVTTEQVWGGENILATPVNLTCGADYYIEVSSIWLYANNASAGQTVQGAIYSNASHRLALGSSVNVVGAGWYESVVSPVVALQSGTYYIAGGFSSNARFYYGAKVDDGSVANLTYVTGSDDLVMDLTLTTYEAHRYSAYVVYNIRSYEGGNVVIQSDVSQSSWLTFGGLFTLSIVCLILAWKSNIPILNFVFGGLTLGAGAYYLGTSMVFAGWANLLAIVMAVVCMISGAIKLRG